MPNWNAVLREIEKTDPTEGNSAFDIVRRNYLRQLSEHTGRNTIAYYSGWMQHPQNAAVTVNDSDMNGFMLSCHEIDSKRGLDLILHTPGGSPFAADAIVNYLRKIYGNNIRAIVPQMAMSAGTMLAMACHEILMAKHSNLGPIDPSLNGIPAVALKTKFNEVYHEIIKEPKTAAIWQPMLSGLGLHFLKQCDWAIEYSISFVARLLEENMLNDSPDPKDAANKIAQRLSDLGQNLSHERRFYKEDCETMGLKIRAIEDDQRLQELILTCHHCYTMATINEGILKIIENDLGQTFAVRREG